MQMRFLTAALFVPLMLSTSAHPSPQHAMPPGMSHDEHLALMKKRGAQAMGFDQDTTQHHFRLAQTGGAIEVAVKDPGDAAGRDQIRAHLREIAADFASGNFEKPLATHGELPPGIAAMQQKRSRIVYTFEETAGGGLVRIVTFDTAARAAVHQFLRYQITEHETGDPLTVGK